MNVKAAVIFLLILFTPPLIIEPVLAAPLGLSEKNWDYVNGNSWAWNYSPATQINKSTVQNLEVKWVVPIESRSLTPEALKPLNPWEGVTTPPLVHDGVVYVQTNYLKTYAIDAKTGHALWTHNYLINVTEAEQRLPWMPFGTAHLHGIRYWNEGGALLLTGYACDMYALEGKTGKERFHIQDLCLNVPGNIYRYSPAANQNSIATYERGRQFIYILSYIEGGGWFEGGRNVVMGIDMDTRQILWRVFNAPPQGVTAKDWALQECDIGYFRDIPCKDVAAKAPENLEWDWAPAPEKPPHPSSGVTATWGQPVVDEDTGLLYLGTGAQVPWPNITLTLGPRLYGSTIMAIDMKKGNRIWWQQPQPRDPYDYDCNWNGILAEDPVLGKVYVKGCKDGHWIVSDAATGKPFRIVEILDEFYPGRRTFHITDPLSQYDMKEWGSPENSKYYGPPPMTLVPSFVNGAFATDESYDPDSNTIYHYATLMPLKFTTLPLVKNRISSAAYSPNFPANVTIVARDLATGNVKWTYFYSYSNQRAHMVVSGGMLFTGFTDGYIRFFDKDTGRIIHQMNIGSPIITGLTTGQDSDGQQKIFVLVGPTRFERLSGYGLSQLDIVPGTVVAIGLKTTPISFNTTTTTTTTVTVTTTSTATTLLSLREDSRAIAYLAIAATAVALVTMALLWRRHR
ncbi:MAG: hypothetical protein HY663_06710 [Chloroflexi bacterium]|nr:hypothetical protein [Chloroflexota bacterium]